MAASETIVASCYLSLNIVLLSPIVIFYLIRFSKQSEQRSNMLITKRYPDLVKMFCYFVIFNLLVDRTIATLFVLDIGGEILVRIRCFTYPLVQFSDYCALARFWLIRYDLCLAKAIEQSSCTKYINADIADNNWWIANKAKYGLPKPVKKILLIVCCCTYLFRFSLAQVLISFDDEGHSLVNIFRAVDIVLILFPVVSQWIIWCKSPSVGDAFYFKKELTYYCIINVTAFVAYILITILGGAFDVDQFIISMSFYSLTSLASIITCMLQTRWISGKVEGRRPSISLDSLSSPSTPSDDNDQTLTDFVSTNEGFGQFMDYLQKEFSLELMLFVIEVTQFKALMVQQNCIPSTDEEEPVLPTQHAPKSSLVHMLFCNNNAHQTNDKDTANNIRFDNIVGIDTFTIKQALDGITVSTLETEEKLKLTAYLLYEKYVANGADLQINICGPDRVRLDNLMATPGQLMQHKMKPTELYQIFNAALDEMMKLMRYSYARFKKKSLL